MVLYIDPGTGSMLFSIAIGLVTMLYFLGKAALLKLKFIFSGGRLSKTSSPSNSIVIYSEGSRYWSVFKPIVEEFENRAIPVQFYTSSEDDPFFNEHYQHIKGEFIGEGNKAFARLNLLEADICLMTTPGLDVYQLKRSKGVKHYSHILHAPSDATLYRLFGLDYYDSVLLTGEYQKAQIRNLEELRGLERKDLEVVGCSYLDVLSEKVEDMRHNKNNNFTVLVAPSWGENGILRKYGERLLTPLVETGFNVIVRPHPQSFTSEKNTVESLKRKYESNELITWDFNRDNLESLSRADIMISDFSGVIFDYLFLFDRPVLYLNTEFDARPYDSWDLEEQPWIFKVLPEIGIELKEAQFDNLKLLLLEASNNTSLQLQRQMAKKVAWQYIGESGKRVCDFLLKKKENLKQQPII